MVRSRAVEEILATGSGTKASPFVVNGVPEEYLVVEHFGKQVVRQRLAEVDGKYCDCLDCSDGTEYWFDVSNTPIWSQNHEGASRSPLTLLRTLILVVLAGIAFASIWLL